MPGPDLEQAALAWLYSLADQERGVGWNPRASADEQWKLGRTRALLDLAGAPDKRMRVVLVAGTKGKSSTCAMLASMLGAHGLRTGLYSKPHLQSYRERIVTKFYGTDSQLGLLHRADAPTQPEVDYWANSSAGAAEASSSPS